MTALDPDDLRRLGSLFSGEPERILAIAATLGERQPAIHSRVQGTSMGATIPDGATIEIKLTTRAPCARGAVIAFLLGARVTVHRVLARVGWRRRILVTGGDARVLPDPPVPAARVLGIVTAVCIDGVWRAPAVPARRAWPVRCARAGAFALLALASLGGIRAATWCAHGLYLLLHPGRARSTRHRAASVTAGAGASRGRAPTARSPAD